MDCESNRTSIGIVDLLGLVAWYVCTSVYGKVTGSDKPDKEPTQQQQGRVIHASNISETGSPSASYLNAEYDSKSYVYLRTPRVANLPHTAPIYDEITTPKTAPVPAMCVQMGRKCQCYSQQGTKMPVEFNLCVDIAQNGYFEEFNPNGIDNARTTNTPEQNGKLLASKCPHVESQTHGQQCTFSDLATGRSQTRMQER